MEYIDKIYDDLQDIINMTKIFKYNIVIAGDFNARLGEHIGDTNININATQKFLPFIKIDLVLINDDWNYDTYNIKMNIKNYQFGSDHKPICYTITLKGHLNNINHGNNEDKFIKPKYKRYIDLKNENINKKIAVSLPL